MHCVVLDNDMMRDKVLLLKILQPDMIPASSAENSPFCRGCNIDPTITSFLFSGLTFGAPSAYLKEIAKTAIEMVRGES